MERIPFRLTSWSGFSRGGDLPPLPFAANTNRAPSLPPRGPHPPGGTRTRRPKGRSRPSGTKRLVIHALCLTVVVYAPLPGALLWLCAALRDAASLWPGLSVVRIT